MFFFDSTYFWLVFIPGVLLSLGVQLYLRSTYGKWSRVANSNGMNGLQVGDDIFRDTALQPIPLQPIPGSLTDHFDPRANVVRLSQAVATQPSVASMAIAAHELGHVEQYQTGSALIKARGFLIPAVQFSPTLSYISFLMGILFNITGLIWVGVFFFALTVLFSLLTLPVELDASRRALRLLDEAGQLRTEEDRKGSKAVLRAAALTYLAALITAVLQLLYYMSIARRR